MKNENIFLDYYFLEIQHKEIKDLKNKLGELRKLYADIYFNNNINNLDRRIEEIEYLLGLMLINKESLYYIIR